MGAAGRAYVISEHGAEVLGERLSALLADL
jgi:hypothetical protein